MSDALDDLTPTQRRWIIGMLRTRSPLDESGKDFHILSTIQERFRMYEMKNRKCSCKYAFHENSCPHSDAYKHMAREEQ